MWDLSLNLLNISDLRLYGFIYSAMLMLDFSDLFVCRKVYVYPANHYRQFRLKSVLFQLSFGQLCAFRQKGCQKTLLNLGRHFDVERELWPELGMRPVYHRKQHRCEGHLFITVLAYQGVQVIRKHLKEKGDNQSWISLKDIFEVQP